MRVVPQLLNLLCDALNASRDNQDFVIFVTDAFDLHFDMLYITAHRRRLSQKYKRQEYWVNLIDDKLTFHTYGFVEFDELSLTNPDVTIDSVVKLVLDRIAVDF